MTNVQILDAGGQASKDALSWVRANTKNLTAREATAYEAGHATGWRNAVAYLKLHGALKVTS